jgi:glycogen(starch) synthase
VIPNGVDLLRFNPSVDGVRVREELGIGSAPLVVSVIRLVKRKGGKRLIEAFQLLQKSVRDVKLAIGGGGHGAAGLRKFVGKLKLEDSVFMLGPLPRERVAQLMAAADVFVLPSEVESCPLTLLEAMGVGTPSVCPDAGGALEIVENGVNGVTVPPGDVGALAEALARVLMDERLARCLRENGFKTARRFSWRRTAKKTLEVYEGVSEEHGQGCF